MLICQVFLVVQSNCKMHWTGSDVELFNSHFSSYTRIISFFLSSPQPSGYTVNQLFGYYISTFDMGTEYNVSLTSSIGNDYSEPVIKYFKDCHEIEKFPSNKTGEL